ncbi:hypothetical protein ACHAXH_002669 [Discostella pseudostelligera]
MTDHEDNTDNDDNTHHHHHQQQNRHNHPHSQHNRSNNHSSPPSPRQHHRRRNDQQQEHSPPPPPSNHINSNYNTNNVGHTIHDSLRAMGLRDDATGRDIRVQFRILSMIYHPDKYSPLVLPDISQQDAQAHFQLLNNAYSYLRSARP